MDVNLPTEEIIKLLPFEANYKVELLRVLPTLDLERATAIEAIIKNLFDVIFSLRYQQNLQIAINNLPPETPVDDTFYQTVRQQTRQDMVKMSLSPGATEATIAQVRDQLQQVVNEKHPNVETNQVN